MDKETQKTKTKYFGFQIEKKSQAKQCFGEGKKKDCSTVLNPSFFSDCELR